MSEDVSSRLSYGSVLPRRAPYRSPAGLLGVGRLGAHVRVDAMLDLQDCFHSHIAKDEAELSIQFPDEPEVEILLT